MRWDPEKVPRGKTMVEHYPELARYPEFTKKIQGADADACLRFVAYMVDEDSPLAKVNNYEERVERAADMSGFGRTDKGNPKRVVKRIMEGEVSEIENMMCRYFIIQNNYVYEGWLSSMIAYQEATHMLRTPVTGKADQIKLMEVKIKVSKAADELRETLMRQEAALFNDERMRRRVTEFSSDRTINYAELFAEEGEVI